MQRRGLWLLPKLDAACEHGSHAALAADCERGQVVDCAAVRLGRRLKPDRIAGPCAGVQDAEPNTFRAAVWILGTLTAPPVIVEEEVVTCRRRVCFCC